MTGPEHYREAERLLADRNNLGILSSPVEVAREAVLLQAATTHATLSLAAAVDKQTRLAHGQDDGGYGA